jgi:hypothetical protein
MIKKLIFFIFLLTLFNLLNLNSQGLVKANINTNPPGATWTISGSNDSGTTPDVGNFRQGRTYQITFSKPGFRNKTISYVGGSGNININLELDVIPGSQLIKANINTNPPGATWTISGSNDSGTTPDVGNFRQGRNYQINFSKPGFKSQSKTYVGGSGDIFVDLERDRITYTLTVKSNVNGAVVFINGQQYGNTPLNANLDQGNYNISVKAGSFRDFNTSINLNSNQTVFANLEQNQLTLSVNGNIAGATVFVNNQQSGSIPCNLSLSPGNYSISVRKQGYKDYNINISLNSNQNIYANLESSQFTLSINANVQGALVFINNQQVGNTPYNTTLNPGTYNIQVKLQGYRPYSTSINLTSNQNINANLEMERVLNIKVPFGAKIFINNQLQNTDWGRDNRNREKWKTFTFFGSSNTSHYNVRIEYFELVVEKDVDFNGGTLTFLADLR